MYMTKHAEQRRNQRGIPIEVTEVIYAYGRSRHVHGAESLTLDRFSIELASDGNRRLETILENYLNTYLVVGESGRIITVARSKRRFRN